MTRFAEAVRKALETFARMAAWEKVGLLGVLFGALFVAGFYFYTVWHPKEMRDVMLQNVRLTDTVDDLKGQNERLKTGLGRAIAAGKQKGEEYDKLEKSFKAAQAAAQDLTAKNNRMKIDLGNATASGRKKHLFSLHLAGRLNAAETAAEEDRKAKEAADSALVASQASVVLLREQLATATKRQDTKAAAEIERLNKELVARDQKKAEALSQSKYLDASLTVARQAIRGLEKRLATLEASKDAIIKEKDKRIAELEVEGKLPALSKSKAEIAPSVGPAPSDKVPSIKKKEKDGSSRGQGKKGPEAKKSKVPEARPEQRPIGVGPFFSGKSFGTCSDVRRSCERGSSKAYVGVCTDRFNSCLSSGCWVSSAREGRMCRLARR